MAWLEARFSDLDPVLLDWRSKYLQRGTISTQPVAHITLLYGLEVSEENTNFLESLFQKQPKLVLRTGKIRKGDLSRVILLDIEPDAKLTILFWKLHSQFSNKHTFIDGKYSPHLTVAWMDEESFSKTNVADQAEMLQNIRLDLTEVDLYTMDDKLVRRFKLNG